MFVIEVHAGGMRWMPHLLGWVLLAVMALCIPACGGSGDSSSGAAPASPPPTVVINSVIPSSFTPPATTTINFTVTGQPIYGAALSIWTPTTGTTLRLLGELDLDVTSATTVSKDWDGRIPRFYAGSASDNAPIRLYQSNAPGNDVYSVRVQRNVLQWRQAGGGQLYTGAGIQDDWILDLSLNWTTGAVTLVGATNLSGGGYSFPMSPTTYWDGANLWTYEDHIKIYQYLLDTSNGNVSYASPGVDLKWTDVGITLATAPSGTYQIGVVSFNDGGEGESALSTVTIP